MVRRMLTLLLVLVISGVSSANDKQKQKKEAEIKSLEQQIRQLREQEGAQLKQTEAHFNALIANLSHLDEREKMERARLEREEKEAMKRIDERFRHILHNIEPKQVRRQIEEALKTLHHIHGIISEGHFDYGGNRKAAQESIAAVEHQLRRALEHDTHEERARAHRDLEAAYHDIEKALAFSLKKYGLGTNRPEKGEPETRAAANRELVEALGMIENTIHLLAAVDHEIKDYEHERRELLKKQEELKVKMHREFEAKIRQLGEEIRRGHEMKKELEHKKVEELKKIREQFGARIRQLEAKIKQLR